jgi:hypothetical protein
MFEPLWNVFKVGDDNQSEAETERYIIDDSASNMSEDRKTEKNYGPSVKIDEENIISHKKGEKLILYFYSALNKSSFSYFSQLADINRNTQNWRVVWINYDPMDTNVMDIIWDEEAYPHLEWYSIDSTSLKNDHLEKYGLTVIPKLIIVNKKGAIEYFGKPNKYDFENFEALERDFYKTVTSYDNFDKEKQLFLSFFSRLFETYGDMLNKFLEYRFEFWERTWVGFKKFHNYSANVFICTVKEHESDANYILTMFEDYTREWSSLHK